jgi:O-antigen/teichoic acid export membrane protein
LNLLLNYVLIGHYGAIGGAYATAVAFAVSAALVFWYQKKNFPMPWLQGVK